MPPCRLPQRLPVSFFLSLLYMNIMMSPDIFLQVQVEKKKKKETKQRKERKSWKGNEASNAVLCSSLLTFTGFDRSMFMNYFRGLLPAWLGCCQKTGWSSSVISDFWWQQRSTEELFRSEVSGTKQTPTGSLTSRPATWLLRANAASNTRESTLISVH